MTPKKITVWPNADYFSEAPRKNTQQPEKKHLLQSIKPYVKLSALGSRLLSRNERSINEASTFMDKNMKIKRTFAHI